MPADHLWHGAIMHRKISDPIIFLCIAKPAPRFSKAKW